MDITIKALSKIFDWMITGTVVMAAGVVVGWLIGACEARMGCPYESGEQTEETWYRLL